MVGEEISHASGRVCFAPEKKLQRFICTMAGQLARMQLREGDYGLERIGSQSEEHFIGNIRSMCHDENRFDTVRHEVARFEYARTRLPISADERTIA
jgi:hypothetical protein